MNSTRILRLPENKRQEYIRTELEKNTQSELKRILKKYGVNEKMNKPDMIDFLTPLLLEWSHREELQLENLQ
jgi:hypothetical protein